MRAHASTRSTNMRTPYKTYAPPSRRHPLHRCPISPSSATISVPFPPATQCSGTPLDFSLHLSLHFSLHFLLIFLLSVLARHYGCIPRFRFRTGALKHAVPRGEDGIAGVCRELDRILREFVTEAKLIAADDGGKGSGRGGIQDGGGGGGAGSFLGGDDDADHVRPLRTTRAAAFDFWGTSDRLHRTAIRAIRYLEHQTLPPNTTHTEGAAAGTATTTTTMTMPSTTGEGASNINNNTDFDSGCDRGERGGNDGMVSAGLVGDLMHRFWLSQLAVRAVDQRHLAEEEALGGGGYDGGGQSGTGGGRGKSNTKVGLRSSKRYTS